MKINDLVKVSVIVASYNSEKTILRALKSIVDQSYSNVEIIIIDGGSSDSTVSLVNQFEKHVDFLVSEADKGIGDAWNKGLRLSTGELVLLHNTDDMWHPKLIARYVEAYENNNHLDGVYYSNCYMHDDGKLVRKIVGNHNETRLSQGLGFGFVHTATMVTKGIYELVGGFSDSLEIAIDTDFLCRCLKKSTPFYYAGETGVYMQIGGVSDKKSGKAYREYLSILVNYDFISSRKALALSVVYGFYQPFRSILKSGFLSIYLRKIKHALFFVMSGLYNYIPTFYLKKMYLGFLKIKVGCDSYILRGAEFFNPGNLIVGRNTIINRDVVFDNRGKINIGSGVSISRGCEIHTAGHDILSPMFDYLVSEVNIGDSVVIFSNSSIMPGVTIGARSVVMSSSVVTKSVPENSLVGGNPARVIKELKREPIIKFDYPYWYAK